MADDTKCRRQFYRVEVPLSEFVLLETKSEQYKVTEISEGGIRFESDEELAEGKPIRGKVFYNGGDCFLVSGKVIRSMKLENSSGWLITGRIFNLSTPTIVAFQSYLVRTYGPRVS